MAAVPETEKAAKNIQTNSFYNVSTPQCGFQQPLQFLSPLAVPALFPIGLQSTVPPPQQNAVDQEIIELDRSEIREIRLRRRQQLQKAHQDRLAELEHEELLLQQQENTKRLSRLEAEEKKRVAEFRAAVIFQKYTRRFLIKSKIPDLKVNEMTKYSNPELYILEMQVLELVRDEFLPEILVEIAEGEYFPYSKSKEFRILRIQYHLVEETLSEMTRSAIREFLCEFAQEQIDGNLTKDPIDEIIDDYMDEATGELTREVLNMILNDIVESHLLGSKCEIIFDQFLVEIVLEMDIARDSIDEVIQESIMDEIVTLVIQDAIYEMSKGIDFGTVVWKVDPEPPKSRFLNFCMEKSLDRILATLLLQVLTTNGASFFCADMVENLMDKHILELLISEFTSLQMYKENTTRDFAESSRAQNSHVPPAVEETLLIPDRPI